ncbi:hypothetical protein K6025_02785 [Ehrlichia sp. JZT12]
MNMFRLSLLFIFAVLFVTTIVLFFQFQNSKLSIKNIVFSIVLPILIICKIAVVVFLILGSKKDVTASKKNSLIINRTDQGVFILSQNQSSVEEGKEYVMFTFFSSSEGLSRIGSMDNIVKLEFDNCLLVLSKAVKLQLDTNYKCQILVDGKSIVNISNPHLCIWINDKSRVEKVIDEIVNKYLALCIKSSEVKNGILSLSCEGCEIVTDRESLKLFLLEPYGNSSDSKYKILLKKLCDDYTGDPKFMCQNVGEGNRLTPEQKEGFWVNTLYGKLAIYLLSMFNPYELLDKKELCQSEQSNFYKQIEYLLNYIQENDITSNESNFDSLLSFIKEYFWNYQVMGENCSLSNDKGKLSDIMLKDLARVDDLCKYIFAIACYNDNNPNYTKTNKFIRDLLISTGHEDLLRKVTYIITCKDFGKYNSLYSEKRKQDVSFFYEDIKINDVLKELSIDSDKEFSSEELVRHARTYIVKKYASQIVLSLSEKQAFSLEVGATEGIVLMSKENGIANIVEIDSVINSFATAIAGCST